MGRRDRPRKITDYETVFRCAGGVGKLREEVWTDKESNVVRYNLAFIMPHLSSVDHGRLLGYDNAHGVHERHHMGESQSVKFTSYPATARRFYREVAAIRRKYEG